MVHVNVMHESARAPMELRVPGRHVRVAAAHLVAVGLRAGVNESEMEHVDGIKVEARVGSGSYW